MADQQITLPTVPTFSAPNSTEDNFNATISSILQGVPPPVKVTASPYSTGHDPSPTLPIRHNFEMSNQDRQPVNDSVQERKMARQQNFSASLGNTVKTYINRHEEKQQQQLTSEITTVMKAQQQIDNAKTVLAGDPNNAMAKEVMQRNMQILDSKLSNDKLRKQIGKAFDVSFIDASKNDTPEIKAGIAAKKQVEAAVKSGTAADTPQEKALAQMHADGGNPSGAASSNKTSAPPIQSSRPGYAQQFMDKLPATIQTNPEYQTQLKQAETRDKYVSQYVLPRLLTVATQHQDNLLKQGNANARAEFKGATDAYVQQLRSISSMSNIDARDKAMIQAQAMRDFTSLKNTVIRANAALEIAAMKGINGTIHAARMQELGIKTFQDEIDKTNKDNTELMTQISMVQNDKSLGDDVRAKKLADLNGRVDRNRLHYRQVADQQQKFMTKMYGTPQASAGDEVVTGNTKGYINGGSDSNAPNSSSTKPKSAGADDSDSTDDESTGDDSAEAEYIDNYPLGDK